MCEQISPPSVADMEQMTAAAVNGIRGQLETNETGIMQCTALFEDVKQLVNIFAKKREVTNLPPRSFRSSNPFGELIQKPVSIFA